MADRVTVERDGGVADVRLNRADKHNALDQEMFRALTETAATLAEDRSLRAVVLSGEGASFCAGLDFGAFMAMGEGADVGKGLLAREPDSVANFAQLPAYGWTQVPVPVIAAVSGHCYGGGMQIALAADFRFVRPDARLSVMEIKWGLIPDMSGTQTLRHLVRADVAKELTFTGRVVSGTESVELGLCTHLSEDPHRDALAAAREIATKSPEAIRSAKRVLEQSRVVDVRTGLALEAELQARLIGSPNQMEAVAANLQKRAPRFSDPD